MSRLQQPSHGVVFLSLLCLLQKAGDFSRSGYIPLLISCLITREVPLGNTVYLIYDWIHWFRLNILVINNKDFVVSLLTPIQEPLSTVSWKSYGLAGTTITEFRHWKKSLGTKIDLCDVNKTNTPTLLTHFDLSWAWVFWLKEL